MAPPLALASIKPILFASAQKEGKDIVQYFKSRGLDEKYSLNNDGLANLQTEYDMYYWYSENIAYTTPSSLLNDPHSDQSTRTGRPSTPDSGYSSFPDNYRQSSSTPPATGSDQALTSSKYLTMGLNHRPTLSRSLDTGNYQFSTTTISTTTGLNPITIPAGPAAEVTETSQKKPRGRPPGSKNRDKNLPPPEKEPKKRGRPPGVKNKPKEPGAEPRARREAKLAYRTTGPLRPAQASSSKTTEELPITQQPLPNAATTTNELSTPAPIQYPYYPANNLMQQPYREPTSINHPYYPANNLMQQPYREPTSINHPYYSANNLTQQPYREPTSHSSSVYHQTQQQYYPILPAIPPPNLPWTGERPVTSTPMGQEAQSASQFQIEDNPDSLIDPQLQPQYSTRPPGIPPTPLPRAGERPDAWTLAGQDAQFPSQLQNEDGFSTDVTGSDLMDVSGDQSGAIDDDWMLRFHDSILRANERMDKAAQGAVEVDSMVLTKEQSLIEGGPPDPVKTYIDYEGGESERLAGLTRS